MLARMRAMAKAHAAIPAGRVLGALPGIGLVLAVVFGIIAVLDLVFGIIGPAEWMVLVAGSTVMIVAITLIHLRGARENQAGLEQAAVALRAAAEAGEVLRHELRRDAHHWFVEHEHGVIMVCPADAQRTLYLDLSSVSDDQRYEQWYARRRIDTATWTWFTTPDGAFILGFDASGPALEPNSLEALAGTYDPDAGGDLSEFLGSPGDGDVVDRPFVEVDAFLRLDLPAVKPPPG